LGWVAPWQAENMTETGHAAGPPGEAAGLSGGAAGLPGQAASLGGKELRLAGKAALVTGGSRGIGRAIAERLAADGAEVVLSYAVNAGAAADVVAVITAAGGRAHAVAADLRDPGAARQLYDQAEKIAGPLDILINNAAIAGTGMIADTSDEDFDAVMTANVKSPFSLIREAVRRLRDGGRIVNISTVNTVLNGPGMAAYAASKAALELLSRVAAYELGEREITFNSVSPGATDTEMFRTANPAGEVHQQIAALTALRRLGQPADVADVVALLVSDDARWLTGQNIRASGGLA
jgi:3-oxoacyl-[acyl-carrier protein] reductase